MRYVLLLLIILSVVACKQPIANNTEKVVTATVPTPAPVSSSQKMATTQARIIENAPTAEFPFNVTLKDADAQLINSNEVFKKNGKPTVLLFWLTTCAPCKRKMSAIKPIYSQWIEEEDFNLYAISGDWSKNFDKFVTYTEQQDWPWPTYNDVNRGFREILPGGLNGYPQSFIFDKDGKLVYQDKRYSFGDEKRLFSEIKKACQAS
jgi:thiol-disulfide isomerase/thioredoxin